LMHCSREDSKSAAPAGRWEERRAQGSSTGCDTNTQHDKPDQRTNVGHQGYTCPAPGYTCHLPPLVPMRSFPDPGGTTSPSSGPSRPPSLLPARPPPLTCQAEGREAMALGQLQLTIVVGEEHHGLLLLPCCCLPALCCCSAQDLATEEQRHLGVMEQGSVMTSDGYMAFKKAQRKTSMARQRASRGVGWGVTTLH
jgi:hypothetical protein